MLSTSSVSAAVLNNAFVALEQAGTDTAATSGQIAAMQTEITTDPAGVGYKNTDGTYKSAAQVCTLFNLGATIPNPTPQGRVALTTISSQDMAFAASKIEAAVLALPADNAYKATLLQEIQLQVPLISASPVFDLTADSVAGLISQVLDSGAMTQQQMDEYTTEMDPAWLPTVTIAPRAPVVLGAGLFATPTDIAAAIPQS